MIGKVCVCVCSSALCQIVCVPRDWRVTLVLIVLSNTAVSFMLEVSLAAVTLVSERPSPHAACTCVLFPLPPSSLHRRLFNETSKSPVFPPK